MGNKSSSSSSSSSSKSSISNKTLSGVGNLIKLLPTGTVFLFQFLNPIVTNNGDCQTGIYKPLTVILLAVCAFSCAFACFTDSYKGSDGLTHYGMVTKNGLWPSPSSEHVNLSSYKLRFRDFVHAYFTVKVFAVVALLDGNTVHCFYPAEQKSTEKILLKVLPPAIGTISGAVFMLFPNKRHGIGYPSSSDGSATTNTNRS
ncbi:hypothetical protein SLEP1_g46908 [Rubroshorea leprosula]|uniref:Uncharacterized protein n=1 Tax=Rubroshorea leprosula TaxID=152421 RepID=A0AAV5LNS1_9ROSI|nr:hypothetical protein SLEP1_g46908 [Rubroshorea leprosula]